MQFSAIPFHEKLRNIHDLISYNELESQLGDAFNESATSKEVTLLSNLSIAFKDFKNAKLLFNFSTVIVSLYGCFEYFIEESVSTYLEGLEKIVSDYEILPEQIRKNHLKQSMNLLEIIDGQNYRGSSTKNNVIENIHLCLNKPTEFKLNIPSFIIHKANFRPDSIDDIFNKIGIPKIGDSILNNKEFRDFISHELCLEPTDTILPKQAFEKITSLANIRNVLAHGKEPTDILDNTLLQEYVSYFEKYSTALITTISCNYLKLEVQTKGVKLGAITDVFHGGSVICIKSLNTPIKVGDTLAGIGKDIGIKTRIISMQLNNVQITEISSDQNYEVGVEIAEKFKKNFEVYLISG